MASGGSSRATYSRSQAWLNLTLAPSGRTPSCGKLRQEPVVVLVKQPDVVDAVLEHGDALDAEPEREPGVALGVVADVLEDRRVDHPGAPDLDPAAALAGAAAAAPAQRAGDVVLGAGLHEGEVGRPQPERQLALEEAPAEMLQGPLQVGEGDPFSDHQPLDLMEDRGVRGIGVAPEHLADGHHLQGRAPTL